MPTKESNEKITNLVKVWWNEIQKELISMKFDEIIKIEENDLDFPIQKKSIDSLTITWQNGG